MVAKPSDSLAALRTFVASPPPCPKRVKTKMSAEMEALRERLAVVESENVGLKAEVANLKLHLKEVLDNAPQRAEIDATNRSMEELLQRTKSEVATLYGRTEVLENAQTTTRAELSQWCATTGVGTIKQEIAG